MKILKVNPKKVNELEKHIQDPYVLMYTRAAVELGYHVTIFIEIKTIRVEHNGQIEFFRRAVHPLNPESSSYLSTHKYGTSLVLRDAGLPVANSFKLGRKKYQAGEWDMENVTFPVVVKPVQGTLCGIGVVTDIKDAEELDMVLQESFKDHSPLLIEEYLGGLKDYRVLILNRKMIGVLYRVPAYVTGDGQQTIQELIDEKNTERAKNIYVKPFPIRIDDELYKCLHDHNVGLDSIPEKDRVVFLRNSCNFGAGGETHNAEDEICEENIQLAIDATDALGLRVSGVDFMCEDISKPIVGGRGAIIELNQNPGIIIHKYPQKGAPVDVAMKIMKATFEG